MSDKILIETSARHVHVTQEALEILFGKVVKFHLNRETSLQFGD